MKICLEISDELLKSAKQFAQRNQTTINALIEHGLRRVLSVQRAENRTAFKLKDASVRGEAMLITDPRRWQKTEGEHVISQVIKHLN
jgi:hypothetical protein